MSPCTSDSDIRRFAAALRGQSLDEYNAQDEHLRRTAERQVETALQVTGFVMGTPLPWNNKQADATGPWPSLFAVHPSVAVVVDREGDWWRRTGESWDFGSSWELFDKKTEVWRAYASAGSASGFAPFSTVEANMKRHLKQSSLGTEFACAAMESVSSEHARRIVEEAARREASSALAKPVDGICNLPRCGHHLDEACCTRRALHAGDHEFAQGDEVIVWPAGEPDPEPADEERCDFFAETEHHGYLQCKRRDGHTAHHHIDPPAPAEPAEERCQSVSIFRERCALVPGHDGRHAANGYAWGYPPAPAESAAEETKADTFDEIAQSLKSFGDEESSFGFNLRFWRKIAEKLIAKYPNILSLPVAPAHNGTAEWPRIEDVPTGVRVVAVDAAGNWKVHGYRGRDLATNIWVGEPGWKMESQSRDWANLFAPFVVAEVRQ